MLGFSKGLAYITLIIENNLVKHIRLVERKYTELMMVLSKLKPNFVLGWEAGGGHGGGMVQVK